MVDVISSMLELFGIEEVPLTFGDFIFWLCSLCAGYKFVTFSVGIVFSFLNKVSEVAKK